MAANQNFVQELTKQIDEAAAVLVLWSNNSVQTFTEDPEAYFSNEVSRGLDRRILVHVAVDPNLQPPFPV